MYIENYITSRSYWLGIDSLLSTVSPVAVAARNTTATVILASIYIPAVGLHY